jgi:hypothetical protein
MTAQVCACVCSSTAQGRTHQQNQLNSSAESCIRAFVTRPACEQQDLQNTTRRLSRGIKLKLVPVFDLKLKRKQNQTASALIP